MGKYWRCGLAAAGVALGAHGAWAQKVTGCPAGQAMQSSDPSGKNITCVAIPDTAALQQQIANEAAARAAGDNGLQQQINDEVAARKAADAALDARIDTLTERDIVGKWSVSGTTNCLQSTNGFNATFNPQGPTTINQLSGTFMGTRTFNSNGTGQAEGTSHTLTFPATFLGTSGFNFGGASTAGLDANFTWRIERDGTLRVDDDGTIPQPLTSPPARAGWTATIENLPPFVGHISKDRKTIVMTHPGMQIETSTTRDNNNNVQGSAQRFCARHRVLTRLAD